MRGRSLTCIKCARSGTATLHIKVAALKERDRIVALTMYPRGHAVKLPVLRRIGPSAPLATYSKGQDMFDDRKDAGARLAKALRDYAGRTDVIVLALPRGGVPVGYEVANALHVPFDILIVRKVGTPGNPELAMGALASGGALYVNRQIVSAARVANEQLAEAVTREQAEVARRESVYRGACPVLPVEGRTAIVVDDGIATGSSMRAALQALRSRRPARVIVAVPVAPIGTQQAFADIADETVVLLQPGWFDGVGALYRDFRQVDDTQVRALLCAAREQTPADHAAPSHRNAAEGPG
jgi:putative phosphoribosyl transferase